MIREVRGGRWIKVIIIPGPNEFVRASDGASPWLQLGRMLLDSLEFSINISNLLAVVFKDYIFCYNDFVGCLRIEGSP